jgi:hypothetical protein
MKRSCRRHTAAVLADRAHDGHSAGALSAQ